LGFQKIPSGKNRTRRSCQIKPRGGGNGGRSTRSEADWLETSQEKNSDPAKRQTPPSSTALKTFPHCGTGHVAQPQEAGSPAASGDVPSSAAQQQDSSATSSVPGDIIIQSPAPPNIPATQTASTRDAIRKDGFMKQH
jgi:hypothetical protein